MGRAKVCVNKLAQNVKVVAVIIVLLKKISNDNVIYAIFPAEDILSSQVGSHQTRDIYCCNDDKYRVRVLLV